MSNRRVGKAPNAQAGVLPDNAWQFHVGFAVSYHGESAAGATKISKPDQPIVTGGVIPFAILQVKFVSLWLAGDGPIQKQTAVLWEIGKIGMEMLSDLVSL